MNVTTDVKRKLNSKSGFSLAEMLMAVLILLMVSSIVATGIPVVKNAYEKVVLASNAEVLLSTAISSLRNELGTAQSIETPDTEPQSSGQPGIEPADTAKDGTIVTYYSMARRVTSRVYVSNADIKEIKINRYYSSDELSAIDTPSPLVLSKKATYAWNDLYVTYSGVTYAGGIVTFHDLAVMRESTNTKLTDEDFDLSIRVISE